MAKRPNPIPPKDRLFVGRQDAADLLSISVGTFDTRVRPRLPQPTTLLGKPHWRVKDLLGAETKLSGEGVGGYDADTCDETDDCPEPQPLK